MTTLMHIRMEHPGDLEAIERLTYQAFENHPHHEPGAEPTEHLIVNRLREAGALTLSLVADDGNQVVGHIAFSPVVINDRDQGWFGLGPVSVVPDRQGEGIGSQLIRAGLERMKETGANGIVLVGEPAYYQRFGFTVCTDLDYPGVPKEYFMMLSLRDQLPVPAGVVKFHKAFG